MLSFRTKSKDEGLNKWLTQWWSSLERRFVCRPPASPSAQHCPVQIIPDRFKPTISERWDKNQFCNAVSLSERTMPSDDNSYQFKSNQRPTYCQCIFWGSLSHFFLVSFYPTKVWLLPCLFCHHKKLLNLAWCDSGWFYKNANSVALVCSDFVI